VATITLNRPEAQNSLNMQLLEEGYAALTDAQEDPSVRVLVITAKGKSFCSGADLKMVNSWNKNGEVDKEAEKAFHKAADAMFEAIKNCKKPIIAAVNGFAIAGGWKFGDEEFFDVIRRIVSCEMGMFDSSPHESFLFVCDRNPVKGNEGFDNYGLHIGRNIILLLDGKLDRSELYGPSMSIVAHEFFHNWNGEAIWPRTSEFLWFTEGATVYYSYQVLLDANIITPSQYEKQREAIIRRYSDNAHLDSIPIVRAANSDLSDKDLVNLLYDGGFLAAEALDRRIEQVSGGSARLIDVLNWMHENAQDGADVNVLAEAVSRTTGYDLSGFLAEMILDPAPDVLDHN